MDTLFLLLSITLFIYTLRLIVDAIIQGVQHLIRHKQMNKLVGKKVRWDEPWEIAWLLDQARNERKRISLVEVSTTAKDHPNYVLVRVEDGPTRVVLS